MTITRLFKEYKPTVFFSLIGTILLILALIFGIPVFNEFFKTGMVPRFPTLIFSLVLLLISILMYITGIILEVVAKKNKQIFELFLIRTKRDNNE